MVGIDRLGQVLVGTELPRVHEVALVALGAEHDHAHVATEAAVTHRLEHGVAIERHHQVEHHRIGWPRLELVQRRRSVIGLSHVEAVAAQGEQQHRPHVGVVVDNQDVGAHRPNIGTTHRRVERVRSKDLWTLTPPRRQG